MNFIRNFSLLHIFTHFLALLCALLLSVSVTSATSPAITIASEIESLVSSKEIKTASSGSIVMITASYCVICKAEQEKLSSMMPWFNQRGLTPIIISLDTPEEHVDDVKSIDASNSALQDLLLSQSLDQLPMAAVLDSHNKIVEHESLIKNVLHIVKEGGLFGKENLRIIQEQTNNAR